MMDDVLKEKTRFYIGGTTDLNSLEQLYRALPRSYKDDFVQCLMEHVVESNSNAIKLESELDEILEKIKCILT